MNWMTLLVRIGIFLIILLIGFLLGPATRNVIERMARNAQDKGVYTFMGSMASNSIKLIAFIIALSSIGVDTTVLVGAFSALGVGLSLALKNNMANVAGGMQILLTRPFKVGDYISVAGTQQMYEGTCTAIEIMYTSLVTYDNTMIIVPNSTLIENVVTNYSDKPYRRMAITIPVALQTDTALACREFAAAASAVPNVLTAPAVSCILNGYNADGTAAVLKLYAYATFDNYWNVLYGINNAIQVRRKELGIDQPQTSVRLTEPVQPESADDNQK
ncbi:mechanosensitive ion channel family protein [Faecalibaculum rodentium]|uniref:mechanosensitive ion channel family protein n=2 Tax=Faecalibaculum rodentium TaxID=1702221 RepID=UPI0023F1A526|nr:mechanosensitive ion channel family protein [Faecalibaculum rodentium]